MALCASAGVCEKLLFLLWANPILGDKVGSMRPCFPLLHWANPILVETTHLRVFDECMRVCGVCVGVGLGLGLDWCESQVYIHAQAFHTQHTVT